MNTDLESYGSMLLYSMDRRHFTFVEIRIELDENVNNSVIEAAFIKTCKRFPYLLVTLAEQDNCLCTIPHTSTPILHHDDLDYVIDYNNNDGFLIRLSTKEKYITFSWFHGLADSSGIYNFLKVMLNEYYTNLGEKVIPAPDTFKLQDTPSEQETCEPLSKVPDIENPVSTTNNKYFNIPARKLKNYENYTFSLSQEKLMAYAAKNGGSPNSITLVEIARSLQKVYPDFNKPIGVSVAINAKPFLQIPKSYKPCTALSVFGFTREHLAKSENELNMLVRRNIMHDISEEVLISFVAATKTVFKIMKYMKNIRTKQLLCFNATTGSVASVAESYVGAIPLGSYEKHIKKMYTIVQASLPIVEINYLNGRFFYSITSNRDIGNFVENLHSNFNNLGFECSEVEKLTLKTNVKNTGFPKLGFNLTTFRMISAVKKFQKNKE